MQENGKAKYDWPRRSKKTVENPNPSENPENDTNLNRLRANRRETNTKQEAKSTNKSKFWRLHIGKKLLNKYNARHVLFRILRIKILHQLNFANNWIKSIFFFNRSFVEENAQFSKYRQVLPIFRKLSLKIEKCPSIPLCICFTLLKAAPFCKILFFLLENSNFASSQHYAIASKYLLFYPIYQPILCRENDRTLFGRKIENDDFFLCESFLPHKK